MAGVFAGQSFASPLSYWRDVPQAAEMSLFDGEAGDDFSMGFVNALVEVDAGQVLTSSLIRLCARDGTTQMCS